MFIIVLNTKLYSIIINYITAIIIHILIYIHKLDSFVHSEFSSHKFNSLQIE